MTKHTTSRWSDVPMTTQYVGRIYFRSQAPGLHGWDCANSGTRESREDAQKWIDEKLPAYAGRVIKTKVVEFPPKHSNAVTH